MNATELFESGKLQEAIEAQIREVKASPGNREARLFLFELLSFAGDIDRAEKQIGLIKYDDLRLQTAVEWYKALIAAERLRRQCFEEGLSPEFLTQPPEHLLIRMEALNRLREDKPDEAKVLLDEANQRTPSVQGELNGKSFDMLRDWDDVCSSFLEVMAHGKYCWLPFEHIHEMTMKAPSAPRDLIWPLVRVRVKEVGAIQVFVSAMYFGSWQQEDDLIKFGRVSDWKEYSNGLVQGLGSRLFLVGEDDIPLLDWRELKITPE